MKTNLVIIIIVLLGFSSTMQAQEDMKYLFGGTDKNVKVTGFGGVINEFSSVDGDFAFSMGGGGAILLNSKFYIGAYGLGLTTRHIKTYDRYDYNQEKNLYSGDLYTRFGQGGFWLGYINNPQSTFHWGVNTKIGWGSITLHELNNTFAEEKWYYYDSDNVFVLTPEVNLGINLLKWMRMDVGVGYRLVTGVNKEYDFENGNGDIVQKQYFDSNAFNSVTGDITLVFGKF